MPFPINREDHYEASFEDLDWSARDVIGQQYDQCRFVRCKFSEARFRSCQFYDCEFLSCDLSLVKVVDCEFSNTLIEDSKAVGINWAEMRTPSVRIHCPVKFIRSNIDYSGFLGVDLQDAQIIECQAREVDFSGAVLSKATLAKSDFTRSLFSGTNLCGADFTHAVNYTIDVTNNAIKGAKFSFPEVVSLLGCLGIEIVDG